MELGFGVDRVVRDWVVGHQSSPLHHLSFWITNAGGITAMKAVAVAAGALLWYRGRRRVAVGVALVPFLANAIFNVIKRLYARPRPLGLAGEAQSYDSFPSGHSTTSMAVCCTLAYVFWREGWIGRRAAIAMATLVPVVVGLSRLYLDVHWTTDVLGGWGVGLLIAILAGVLYEMSASASFSRQQRPNPSSHPDSMRTPAE